MLSRPHPPLWLWIALAIALLTSGSRASARSPAGVASNGIVVYSLRGDIYTKELSTGQVQRLTRDGLNVGPRWSPSGRWITFHKREDKSDTAGAVTWVMRRDGFGARSLCCSEGWDAFSWSPSGDEIFTTSDDGVTVALCPDTGKTRHLVSPQGGVPSPDGKWLAYVTTRPVTRRGGDDDDCQSELWCVRFADGKKTRRLYTSHGHDAVPELLMWSADSKFVLFWEPYDNRASSVNADGIPLYAIAIRGGKARPIPGRKYADEVLESPDFIAPKRGTAIVSVSVGGSRFRVHNKRIVLVNLATGVERCLTSSCIAAIYPVWSPDRKRIAFFGAPETNLDSSDSAWQAAFRQIRLWAMDADGSHQRRLDSGTVHYEAPPRWLADGRNVVYEQDGDEKPNSVWVIDIVTNRRRCIVPAVGGMGERDVDGSDFDLCFLDRR